jgi:TRAP-type C4-dicarboxylate transport system permease small subunit
MAERNLFVRCLLGIDAWAEELVVSLMLALLVLLLGTEVFSRFVLGKSFTWIEELCRYLFVWSSYLGMSIAVKRKEQLRILMLINMLEKFSPKLVKICFVVSELIFTAFCLIVFYSSLKLIENMSSFRQVSAALEIDVKYAYLIIPISMFLTAFRTLQSLYRDFRNGTLQYETRKD